MNDEEDDYVVVHIRRRTPEEQVEWLLFQVALLVAKVNGLERDNEAMITAIKSLENRVAYVERATPWQGPRKPIY